MITFKNIAGNKFLAVGTIQRKSALNGEKSLTGTLYDGDDVLNKIDKGWSLEFDNEPYIVTYFERNDNDNSVSFDAIHKFFWDMAKNVLYSETSGSHTIKWYLDQIFANTGYSYALNFNPNAIAKDNWGMKNKLSLFNDVITSIEGEFEINGTLVSIFKNIGTDLSTIVRYGFNLSDMTIENDASGFVTYGEGFGAYADQENMTGDRLHVTYTSPLASVYGKLQAEPIDDQRYTIESNLLDAVKSQVDTSFSISVNLSLYDLSVAGYPYKMANVGDWLTAVDENLDFKQRIRIISIDDEFAADGTRISYSVTAGDIGLTKKYQDANASIANKVEDAVISAGQAATDANIALIAANGKNKSYHLNDINDLPKTANEGDLAWVQSGDGRVLYIYTKKADGTYYWEKRIDPEMGEQIEAGVNEAIAQANENTATAIEQNNISQQEVMNDIAKSQADLAIKDGDFNNKAQAMADKALSDAKANTATVAQETLDTATENLNAAKQSLTTDLQTEISDRTNAVAALDIKANGYAEQAEQDAIDAATTADGTINKKIDETASSLTSKITQNKQDTDGKITTAQSTATQALNEVKTKVSQTEYNTKTGQLTTDVNSVTQTANQSKQDIVSINQKDGQQDSRMNSIESDANGTKQTISNIQTVQGNQSGSITTLQSRADGVDVSVTNIKNQVNSLGQTNQLINTEFNPDFASWAAANTGGFIPTLGTPVNGSNSTKLVHSATTSWQSYRQQIISAVPGTVLSASINILEADGTNWSLAIDSYSDSGTRTIIRAVSLTNPGLFTLQNLVVPDDSKSVYFSLWAQQANAKLTFSKPMFVFNNTVGDYVQGSYSDIEGISKAQLTADQATLSIQNYKADADGRITKAQSDITQTANQVATKVSQTDYDTKTGDLSTSVSKAQQTADSAVTTIGNYKTSNDNRVSSAETKISQNSNDISLRATKTDLDAAKTDYTAKISQINVNYDGISQTVSELNGKVNDLSQINLVSNSEFSPDLSGWFVRGDSTHISTPDSSSSGYNNSGHVVLDSTGKSGGDVYYTSSPSSIGTSQQSFAETVQIRSNVESSLLYLGAVFYDVNKNAISGSRKGVSVGGNWLLYINNGVIPSNAKYISFDILIPASVRSRFVISQPMLVAADNVGSYVQGGYVNNDKIAAQKITIDGITNTVSNQGTNISNLTSRVQTAEGNISTATDNISGMQTNLTQTSNQIAQEITDRTTGDSNTLQSAKNFTQSNITSYDSGLQSQLTQTNNSLLATISANNLIVDSSLTDSSAINSIVNWTPSGQKKWYYSAGVSYNGVQSMGYNQTGLDGDYSFLDSLVWSNFSFTGTTLNVSVDVKANTIGSAETDYLIVYLIEADADMKTVAQTSITGTLRDSNSSWTNYRKRITVNSASKNFYLRYQMRGNGNVYVARPYVGVQELVAGGYTAGTNNNNQTILSLFKDNWSIGITDNIGAITSGIVGNSSSMSLISKNVIIDSPSTQITGTAWINSAMIKDGAIGTAQIGDAAITNAKIANLDVSKITGNVTNFIQSNWNGVYGSTTITSSGMTIVSPGTVALFNVNGMTLDGAGGMTRVANGFTQIYSATHENIGMIGHQKDVDHDNVDYITFGLNGYRTTNEGDSHWVGGSDFYGGDGMGFGVSNKKGTYDLKLRWDSDLIAGYKGEIQGWHANDAFIFDDKTYHKGYADFSGGVTMSGAYSEGTRSLHTQGMSISTGAKWFGFMDSSNSTGFGTDQTNDVLFYVKGQVYSLYTMLGKLGMR
ncbi:phage tail protein [Leuconostoc mesenteroides]|uniref:phage tail protein n=1 Tax=Leuconostoc mesenteroides TaxID=1245 RepID=UPI0023616530|nr:phage tail protein [Leuconostoc mesenteroides]